VFIQRFLQKIPAVKHQQPHQVALIIAHRVHGFIQSLQMFDELLKIAQNNDLYPNEDLILNKIQPDHTRKL
jgi:hypothetical protein